MAEQTVPASEARAQFAELMEQAEKSGRVVITRHGKKEVVLISFRELMSLEETLAILENDDVMRSLKVGLDDVRAGRVRDARDAFSELDAEFRE